VAVRWSPLHKERFDFRISVEWSGTQFSYAGGRFQGCPRQAGDRRIANILREALRLWDDSRYDTRHHTRLYQGGRFEFRTEPSHLAPGTRRRNQTIKGRD